MEKLEGCDSMVCGSDAHGGNRQPGCGKGFRWSQAKPYQPRVDYQGAAPTPPVDEPDRNEGEHVLLGRTNTGEAILMPCDHCKKPECGEIAFQCINCPGKVTVCIACMPQMTQGGHDGTHVFRIIGEWNMHAEASGAGPPVASAPPGPV